MDLDKEQMYESLLLWVDSFDLSSGPATLQSLSSGRPIAEVLSALDAEFFGNSWFSGMPGEDANWRIKASNLRKVTSRISEWYNQVLDRPIPTNWQPDIKVIVQCDDSSKVAITHLFQLLVGVAVNCSNKSVFIQNIMTLDESVQESVMRTITELDQRTGTSQNSENNNNTSNSTERLDQLNRVKCERDELSSRCFELDNQVAGLQDEKHLLSIENQKLFARIAEAGNMDDPNTPAGRKFQQLSQQIERLQDDLFKTESTNEDLHGRMESLGKENDELKTRVEELVAVEQMYRKLKDDAEEFRTRAIEVKKLESAVESYRRKLEEQGDLKAQVKILENKNENYMKSVIELEEEQRKNSTLKTQLEAYKRQTQELEAQLTSQVKRADKAEFEGKRLSEKVAIGTKEKDRIVGEKDYWKEYADELKTSKESVSSGSEESPRRGESLNIGSPAEFRDRLQRLEAENQMLRQTSSSIDQVEILRGELDMANSRKQELETELRLSHQKVLELGGRLEDVESEQEERQAGGDARLTAKHQQIERLSVDIEQLKHQLKGAEKQLIDKDTLVAQLQTILETKDCELRASDLRFKSYMEKARTVIVGLEQSRSSLSRTSSSGAEMSRPEFESLRKELEQKDKQMQRLMEEQERVKIMREQEERLVTTAFHNVAMQQQRQSARDRISVSASQQRSLSFLNRQREVVSPRRTTTSGTLSTSLVMVLLIIVALWLLFGHLCCQNPMLWPLEKAVAFFSSAFRSQMTLSYVDGPPPW